MPAPPQHFHAGDGHAENGHARPQRQITYQMLGRIRNPNRLQTGTTEGQNPGESDRQCAITPKALRPRYLLPDLINLGQGFPKFHTKFQRRFVFERLKKGSGVITRNGLVCFAVMTPDPFF
jgi:hypothetical protein